jgi:ParB/RepB/Spo0J family partition protein
MAKNKSAKIESKATAGATEYVGTREGTAMMIVQLPIGAIRVVPGFNVRQISEASPDGEGGKGPYRQGSEKEPVKSLHTTGADGDSLAADIKRNGLLQPVIVRPTKEPGVYDLVSGHRRFAAVKKNEMKTIPAVVRSMGDEEALLINLTENIQREDLSPGEVADRAVMMRKKYPETYGVQEGGTVALAKAMGVARTYLNNLLRMGEKLAPEIWKLFRSGKNENCPPQSQLLKWASMDDHAEQWAAFEQWAGLRSKSAKGEDGEKGEGGDEGEAKAEMPAREYKRPSAAALEAMEMELLARKRGKNIAEGECAIALAVLRYAIGKIDKSGNAPEAPYQAAKSPTDNTKK